MAGSDDGCDPDVQGSLACHPEERSDESSAVSARVAVEAWGVGGAATEGTTAFRCP
jgi:hypothetical protein